MQFSLMFGLIYKAFPLHDLFDELVAVSVDRVVTML